MRQSRLPLVLIGAGVAALAVYFLRSNTQVRQLVRRRSPDDHLVDIIRDEVHRFASQPHAIDIYAKSGVVTLYGPLPPDEAQILLTYVRAIPGVLDVITKGDAWDNKSPVQ